MQRFLSGFKRSLRPDGLKKEKRAHSKRADIVTEQVKKMLQNVDQKLILMVRG